MAMLHNATHPVDIDKMNQLCTCKFISMRGKGDEIAKLYIQKYKDLSNYTRK